MIQIFTLHRQPNDIGKNIYDQFKQAHKCFFLNSGNMKTVNDEWVQKNVIFENDFSDNISNLNLQLNEITTQYCAWKNLLKDVGDDEWIQFSHYRRWLNLPNPLDETVDMYVRDKPKWDIPVIEQQFKKSHPPIGWDIMEFCLKKFMTPNDHHIFDEWKISTDNSASCNLVAAKIKTLKIWWEWIFPRILYINSQIPYESTHYQSEYQSRGCSFIVERVFMFWAYLQKRRGMNIKEVSFTFKGGLVK